jgi:hypothetical protein
VRAVLPRGLLTGGDDVRLQKAVTLRLGVVAAPVELLGVNEVPHY